MSWLVVSAVVMLLTAGVHSYLGEKRLIMPMLAIDAEITRNPLARMVTRLAWHFTAILMALSAAAVAWPGAPKLLVLTIGSAWLVSGLLDALFTKGKHVGWPFITIAGALALIGAN